LGRGHKEDRTEARTGLIIRAITCKFNIRLKNLTLAATRQTNSPHCLAPIPRLRCFLGLWSANPWDFVLNNKTHRRFALPAHWAKLPFISSASGSSRRPRTFVVEGVRVRLSPSHPRLLQLFLSSYPLKDKGKNRAKA
jgi:hypothetical protein